MLDRGHFGNALAGVMFAVFFVCLSWRVAEGQPVLTSVPPKPSSASRVYAGVELAGWHERMKDIDPKSFAAVSLVRPFVQIVQDGTLSGKDREPFAAYLARMGIRGRAAVPVMIRLIESRTQLNQDFLWATRALALMGNAAADATPVLIDLVFDHRLPVSHRRSAIEALARIGSAHPDAVRAILRLVQLRPTLRGHVELRLLAVKSLAVMGQGAELATPLLMRVLRQPGESYEMRRHALAAIGAIGPSAVVAIPTIMEELVASDSAAVRDSAAAALVRLNDAAEATIVQALQHSDAEVRWRVADACRDYGGDLESLRSWLLKTLNDQDAKTRISAAETIQKTWQQQEVASPVVDIAIEMLVDQDRHLRMRAKKLILAAGPLNAEQQARLQKLTVDERKFVSSTARGIIRQLAHP